MAAAKRFLSVDYEVFGRVQGVFFRKYTKLKARELELVGWVKNTKRNTVIGQMQGESDSINTMKEWLKHTGSRLSRIERCVFTNETTITSLLHRSFEIKK